MKKSWIIAIGLTMGFVAQAQASSQIYHGNNPRITPTANPYNADNILKQAELTRPKDPKAATVGEFNEADLLKRSVVSSLSARYTSLLTGSSPDNGIINFGDGSTAEYRTQGGIRYITFRDASGRVTEISFPI